MIQVVAGSRASSSAHKSLTWSSSAYSAIGNRNENQDAYWCSEAISSRGELSFVVADGMGGGRDGRWAAQTATRIIADALHTQLASAATQSAAERLCLAIARANTDIHAHATNTGQQDELRGGQVGCALAAGMLNQNTLTIAHVGDVRVYLWRQGRLQALTRDHSWAVAAGEEADWGGAMRHVLLRAVGPEPQVEPDVHEHQIEAGDVVVACTDGVWSALPEAQMEWLIARTPPRLLASRLVQAAHERDAGDNATALVIALQEEDLSTRRLVAVTIVIALLIGLIVLIGALANNLFGSPGLPPAHSGASQVTPSSAEFTQGSAPDGADAVTPSTPELRLSAPLPQPTATLAVVPIAIVCSEKDFNYSQGRCAYAMGEFARPQAIYVSWDPPSAQLRRVETMRRGYTATSQPTLAEQTPGYIRLDASAFGRLRPNTSYVVRLHFVGLASPTEVHFKVVR